MGRLLVFHSYETPFLDLCKIIIHSIPHMTQHPLAGHGGGGDIYIFIRTSGLLFNSPSLFYLFWLLWSNFWTPWLDQLGYPNQPLQCKILPKANRCANNPTYSDHVIFIMRIKILSSMFKTLSLYTKRLPLTNCFGLRHFHKLFNVPLFYNSMTIVKLCQCQHDTRQNQSKTCHSYTNYVPETLAKLKPSMHW